MICRNCSSLVEQGKSTCPNCGSPISSYEEIKSIDSIKTNSSNPFFRKKEENTNTQVQTPMDDKSRTKSMMIYGSVIAVFVILMVVLVIGPLFKSGNSNNQVQNSIVGNERVGYLTLTNEWSEYTDEKDSRTLRYVKDNWVIAIDAIKKTEELDYEELAKASYYDKKKDENVASSTATPVKFGDYDAFQVSSYYKNTKTWLVEWFFDAEDERVHYIAIQGDDLESDVFNVIDTYKLEK